MAVNRGYPSAIADEIAMEAQAGGETYQDRDAREDSVIERILQVAYLPDSPRRRMALKALEVEWRRRDAAADSCVATMTTEIGELSGELRGKVAL